MHRFVVSYKLISSDGSFLFVDFDDPCAIYVNDETFDQALFAAIDWIVEHDLDDVCCDFEICGIKRVYT